MTTPSHNDLRERVARELLAILQADRLYPDGAWEQYDETTRALLLQNADRILSLLPTQGSPGSGALDAFEKAVREDERYDGLNGTSEALAAARAKVLEPPEEGSAPVPTAEVGALRWTREKPTAEGFYWVCHDLGEACIVEISEIAGVWYVFDTDGSERHLSKFNHECQWAGPIPAPATPSGEGRQ